MEFLEKSWDTLSNLGTGLVSGFERFLTTLFGSSNTRSIRRLQPKVEQINELEEHYQEMSDEELREQTEIFRNRLAEGETLDDILVEAFAVCREGGRRFLNMRHYDVQLLGGMVLHEGCIAEMVTGEGKTLVATLAAYLNALEGHGVHVVTVNDYLARRDMEWMGPLYIGLGLTVGAIQSQMEKSERQKQYSCDITYGTNNEFGFDYLRDNMCQAARGDDDFPRHLQQAQGPLHYAIIDEVDNILIDEARTPLIISGAAHDDLKKYERADKLARQLKKEVHFTVKEKEHTVTLTDEGVRFAEKLAGVESFYTPGNMEWPHLIDNALKAHYLYQRDVRYMVEKGEVIIVDEFTGRKMPGRQWSDGLHQAVEAKEGVKIKAESQTYATITLQNYFKLYRKISGMTGTAMTEATEFWKIYEMDVVAIPTNKSLRRVNHADVIYTTEKAKWKSIVEEIESLNKWDCIELKKSEDELYGTIVSENDDEVEILLAESKQKERVPREKIQSISRKGRPILVGTTSIEKSERLSGMLDRNGIKHEVLNAKHHEREAEIIAQAGRKGAVTIATNMAGRGTDIVLGGNPETMAWSQLQHKYPTRLDVPKHEWEALVQEIEKRENMKIEGREVAKMGGLHVLGTERHEARRIDLQLVGRSGRQGDPGSSRFYLSLEDDLMRIFGGDWVKRFLENMGMPEDEPIISGMVSSRIQTAQKKVEDRNFEARKNLLEYDEVMDEQRKRIYGYRQRILEGANCKFLILEMLETQIDHAVDRYLDRDYGLDAFAAFAAKRVGLPVEDIEASELRNLEWQEAQELILELAERKSESQILDAIEENLSEEDEPADWNWKALVAWANGRWGLNLKENTLRKLGPTLEDSRDLVAEELISHAREAIHKISLEEGAPLLKHEYRWKALADWAKDRLTLTLETEDLDGEEPEAVKEYLREQAAELYARREAEFAVHAAMLSLSTRDKEGNRHLNLGEFLGWASQRFNVPIAPEQWEKKSFEEVRAHLAQLADERQEFVEGLLSDISERTTELFGELKTDEKADAEDVEELTLSDALDDEDELEEIATWARDTFGVDHPAEEWAALNREEFEHTLARAVERKHRPEIRRIERWLVLNLLDAQWKSHLITMDYLRSSVAFRGYAQVDPKVEYKKEGMQAFETMWQSLGEQIVQNAFRMEQLDEAVMDSVWSESEARHDSVAPPMTPEQEATEEAIEGSQRSETKVQPIRNRYANVGRNDKCPCGSGKKFKVCCWRLIQAGKPPRWESGTK